MLQQTMLSSLRRYLLTILIIIPMIMLLVLGWWGPRATFLPFFLLTMVVARYFGWGPALVCTLISSAALDFFVIPPLGFGISDPKDGLAMALFVLGGVGISTFMIPDSWERFLDATLGRGQHGELQRAA